MEKLVVVIMGQNCEKFLPMCLKSVVDADEIIYLDGGSTDSSLSIARDLLMRYEQVKIITNEYNQDDPQMNGKQRNFYLNYLKENFKDYWALCLDADEVVEDLSKIKEFIQEGVPGIYSVKMRHFHNDIGHEDATNPEHFVLNRLFKVSEAGEYPLVEHPVLQATKDHNVQIGLIRSTTIWHLAHIQHCFEIKKRYEKNLKHSNMHTPEYLKNWYFLHMLGQYPNQVVNPIDIPEVILNYFGIDKDEFYFMNRGLEIKHFIMLKQWTDYIKENREWKIRLPSEWNLTITEYGAGLGPFGFAAKILGFNYEGIEISKFAVKLNPFKIKLTEGDIRCNLGIPADLVICFDVLEHLDEKDLDKALINIREHKSKFIFSIPFLGDPNLELDKTHKIKKSKEWWVEKLSKYFKIKDAPSNWLYGNQILIGENDD